MKHECHDCGLVRPGEFTELGAKYEVGEQFNPDLHGPNELVFLCNVCLDESSDAAFYEDWRREMAMEAGMLHGCEGYNDYYG